MVQHEMGITCVVTSSRQRVDTRGAVPDSNNSRPPHLHTASNQTLEVGTAWE